MPVVDRLGRWCPRRQAVAICTGLLVALGAIPGGAAPTPPTVNVSSRALSSETPRTPVPGSSCSVFPSNNVWNTNISKLPVAYRSRTWLRTMKASSSKLRPAFGPPPYGKPFAVVGNSHPKVYIKFEYPSGSDPGPYPFGPDTPIEMSADAHALMVNRDTCMLYELFRADWNGGHPLAGSGAIFNLGSNKLRPNGWTSADAAGLPIFAGLIRYEEVLSGAITHAIRFTTPRTDCRHIWPARHDSGTCSRTYPPMGARFRLKASYGLSRFSWKVRVILRALKRYGMFVADQGPNWQIWGTMDSRWTDTIRNQLKTVPASAFVAVNESACLIDRNSGAANCP